MEPASAEHECEIYLLFFLLLSPLGEIAANWCSQKREGMRYGGWGGGDHLTFPCFFWVGGRVRRGSRQHSRIGIWKNNLIWKALITSTVVLFFWRMLLGKTSTWPTALLFLPPLPPPSLGRSVSVGALANTLPSSCSLEVSIL